MWGNFKGCKELKVVCTLFLLDIVMSSWMFIIHSIVLLDQLDYRW